MFCVCFGDFICRIIGNVVLVLCIACFLFNYKLIHEFEGPFLLDFNACWSVYIQTLLLYTIAVLSLVLTTMLNWGAQIIGGKKKKKKCTLASVSVTKLLTAHHYCTYTPLFHFLMSTFGFNYVKTDGKWDSQRKSSLRFFNSHFVKSACILRVCKGWIWTLNVNLKKNNNTQTIQKHAKLSSTQRVKVSKYFR